MASYLMVCRLDDDETARRRSAELTGLARRQGFAVSELNAVSWLAVAGPQAPRVMRVSNWILVGDVFNRRSPDLPVCSPDDPWSYERKMAGRFWGRYVGVQFGARQKPVALMRDPSGALECVAWTEDGLLIICSAAFHWLTDRSGRTWRINLERLDCALRDPLSETGPLLLEGPCALSPGTVQPLPLDAPPVEIWRPRDHAAASLTDRCSPAEAAARLRDAIDEATAGLAGLSRPLAAEVSGGLDSSIVASSIRHVAPNSVTLWLNAYGSTPESDERHYACALGRTLGFVPVAAPHARASMDEAWFEAISCNFRPGLNALDRPHDLEWARRLKAAGASALITGRGGDTILLQTSLEDVFVDRWRDQGWWSLFHADAREMAAACETSLWTLGRQARRRRRQPHDWPARAHAVLSTPRSTPAPHPWLADWDRFGPAKALQIAGLADSVARHGASELTESVDVRSPLCAQPVIEVCLALPATTLTLGGRERGLARHAFRDRLPSEIIERRSKGDMTQVYGRMIGDNLSFLRRWLIDGRLAAHGIVDPVAADRTLTRETLLWQGRYAAIMVAATFEGWVRSWERRLGTGS